MGGVDDQSMNQPEIESRRTTVPSKLTPIPTLTLTPKKNALHPLNVKMEDIIDGNAVFFGEVEGVGPEEAAKVCMCATVS